MCSNCLFTGNQMGLGGGTMGVTSSEQTNLHSDSLPNSINTNKSVPSSHTVVTVLLENARQHKCICSAARIITVIILIMHL